MMQVETISPPFFVPPSGYAHMTRVAGPGGTLLLFGGVTGIDADGMITAPGDLVGQMDRTLANLKAAIEYAGGQVGHIVRMRLFTTDMAGYRAHLKEMGPVWRKHFGRHYPAMALLGVKELFDPACLLEIEAEAVWPS